MTARRPGARGRAPGAPPLAANTPRGGALAGAALALLIAIALAMLQGCAAPPTRGTPLPQALSAVAGVPGIPQARHWGDERPAGVQDWLDLPEQELREAYGGIMDRPHHYLVISGGGSDGAFGAGLLRGWTEHGTRPEFQIVTGTSTGALIAPFAFLGSDYDAVLEEMYTRYSTADLIEPRGPWRIVRGDAAVDVGPLRALIARYVNDEVIEAIAAQGRRGRSLLVGTTNLDAGRPVIWDITRLAASEAPGARELIHDVILASASIPGVFPPVLIEVEADGGRYDEMHVDGGVMGQLFFGARGIEWDRVFERLGVVGTPELYVIRNGRMTERWNPVERRLFPIVNRTLGSLIRTQGIGDLVRIYAVSRHYGLSFRLAHVPDTLALEPAEPFDAAYMRALFDLAYESAREGYPWRVLYENDTEGGTP